MTRIYRYLAAIYYLYRYGAVFGWILWMERFGARCLVPSIVAAAAGLLSAQTLPNAVPMPTPVVQYVNSAGVPLAGSFLCSFAAGTTNPLATYTDSTAGTPNTNPIVLDSNGRAQIWVGAPLYKFILYTGGNGLCPGSGAVVWSADNVADTTLYFTNFVKTAGTATLITYVNPLAGAGGASRTVTSRLSDQHQLKDFGIVCDGTNEAAKIQAVINAVVAVPGGTIHFPPGTCGLGATGITLPVTSSTSPGIVLEGAGNQATTLSYTGTGAAVRIGTAAGFTYAHSVQRLNIDVGGAGISAIGLEISNCLYCSMRDSRISSNFNAATSLQVGLQLDGGVLGSLFGAYFNWVQNTVKGSFKYGVYMTGVLGWNYSASSFNGGAIVHDIGVVAGTIGFFLQWGGQNAIGHGLDIENFATGYEIDDFSNTLFQARSEANTVGLRLGAVGGGSNGGASTTIAGGSFADGYSDLSGGPTSILGALIPSSTTRIGGSAFLDTSLTIPGNNALVWSAVAAGSSGLFWKNGGVPIVAGFFRDATATRLQESGVDVLRVTPANFLEIPKGIFKDGAGYQHIVTPAASQCSTAAAVGATCAWTITWNTPFADTNYTPVCSIFVIGSGVPVLNIATRTTTQITGNIIALTAAAANGGLSCTATHW